MAARLKEMRDAYGEQWDRDSGPFAALPPALDHTLGIKLPPGVSASASSPQPSGAAFGSPHPSGGPSVPYITIEHVTTAAFPTTTVDGIARGKDARDPTRRY